MKGTLKGAALGAVIASAAALLLAPKSGKKTRADLNTVLHSVTKDLKKKVKKMQNLSQTQYEELFLSSLAQAARRKEEVVELVGDVTEVLRKGWNDVRHELKEASKKSQVKSKK